MLLSGGSDCTTYWLSKSTDLIPPATNSSRMESELIAEPPILTVHVVEQQGVEDSKGLFGATSVRSTNESELLQVL
jgi:hypothetical protein